MLNYGSGFQPSSSLLIKSQGVALGWYGIVLSALTNGGLVCQLSLVICHWPFDDLNLAGFNDQWLMTNEK
jgi:hypothetical protein